jgi:hypothetical protein
MALLESVGEKNSEIMVETLLALFSTRLSKDNTLLLSEEEINSYIAQIFSSL